MVTNYHPQHNKHITRDLHPLFGAFAQRFPGEYQNDGEYHPVCPSCGKAPGKPGKPNCSIDPQTGLLHCFSCGEGGHISKYVDRTAPLPPITLPNRPSKQPKRFTLTGRDVDRYAAHPHTHKLWAAQGVAPEMVDCYRLGVKNTPRGPVLTVPIDRAGKLVGMRTRGPDGWRNETGSGKQLYKVDDLEPGAIVILVANNRDALNLQYAMPEISGYKVVTVSLTTGEGSRLGPFAQDIADSEPRLVIVAYDNDETGRVQSAKREKELTAAGVKTIAWRWSPDLPNKYDVGDMLKDFNNYHPDRGDVLTDFTHWLRQKLSAVVGRDTTPDEKENTAPPQTDDTAPDFALDIESLSQTVGTLSEQYNDFAQSINGCWFSEGLPDIVASAIKFDAPPSELYKPILPTDGSGPVLTKWVQHDTAKGLAVWFVAHEAVKAGLFAPDGYITRGMIQKASGQVGHALTDHTIREGLNWLAHYGVWEFIGNSVKSGHYIEPSSYSIQISHGFMKPRSNADLYKPRPIEDALYSLAKKLRYEIPAPFQDWLSSEDVQALRTCNVTDTINHAVHRALLKFDSVLDDLTNMSAVLRSPVFAAPFAITNAKTFRVAFLRAYVDAHIGSPDKLQMSIHEKALMLGISSSSVMGYTEAAGLATDSQFKVIQITGKDVHQRQAKFNQIKNKRGVYVQTEDTAPIYITQHNAPAIAEKVINSLEPVTVTIQQPSRLYVADRNKIETDKSKRAGIHEARKARREKERAALGIAPPPKPTKKPRQRPTPPCEVVTTPRPDGYTFEYQKTMVTLLVYLNPHLHDIAQHDDIIAGLLDRYGLLKVRTLLTDSALARAG